MSQRLDYIDIAKGLGILTVIYSHSGGEGRLMVFIGGFFIPLFFVLSGYTFRIAKGQTFGDFLKKRARRLLVPYFILGLFLMVTYHCLQPVDFIGLAYSRFCLCLFESPENVFFLRGGSGPLWFLTSMFTASIAVWWLFKSGRYKYYVVAGYLLLTFALDRLPILLPWSIDTAFLMALFILIGHGLRLLDTDGSIHAIKPLGLRQWVYVVLAAAYFLLCLLNGAPNLSVRVYAHSFLLILLTGTIGSVLVIKVSQWLEHTFLKNIFADFGRHSLVIFCVQMLMLRLQNQMLFSVLHIPLNTYTLYATSIFKTIVAAVIGMYVSKALKKCMPSVF